MKDPVLTDNQFAESLAAYDEAIRSKDARRTTEPNDATLAASTRLRRAAEVVDVLEKLWPRK